MSKSVTIGAAAGESARSLVWWIAGAFAVSAFTLSLWQLGFAQIAGVKLGLPASEHGRALGLISVLTEIAAILTAVLAAYVYTRRQAFEWITLGLLLLAAAFGFAVASETIQDFRVSQIVNRVGTVFVLLTGFIWINENALERQRGKLQALLFFCIGLATVLTSLIVSPILSNILFPSEFTQWFFSLLLLILCAAMAFALWTYPAGKFSGADDSGGMPKPEGTHSGAYTFGILAFGLSGAAGLFVTSFLLLWVVTDAAGNVDIRASVSRPVVMAVIGSAFTGLITVAVLSLLIDRLNRLILTLIFCLMMSVGFLGIGLAPGTDSPSLIIFVMLTTVAVGGLPVASLTLVGQETPPGQYAKSIGSAFAVLFLLNAVLPVIGGIVDLSLGVQMLFLATGLVFAVVAIFGLAKFRSPS